MITIRVSLKRRSYPIVIESGATAFLPQFLVERFPDSKIAIITDRNVSKLYCQRLIDRWKSPIKPKLIVLPPGESTKNLTTVQRIYTYLLNEKFERNDLIVALGGGVVGDLAGYVAATYLRGIAFLQVPTTLVAQCDSSIGGKVGVNHPLGKNLIGTFYQPRAVIIDPDTLQTLPVRELRSGLAEMVKYALINDAGLFTRLESNLSSWIEGKLGGIEAGLAICCRIKSWIVARDEYDHGLRRKLNFGHTFGHALEAATHFRVYRHGEAISLGMVIANIVARDMDLFSETHFIRANRLLSQLVQHIPHIILPRREILQAIELDKKRKKNVLHLILPIRIGKVVIRSDISEDSINQAMNFLSDWLRIIPSAARRRS